jgi:hypothetical protein
MAPDDLECKTLALLALSVSLVTVTGRNIEARPQEAAQVPVVSSDPTVQRSIEATLTRSDRLDPLARAHSLELSAKPIEEIIDAVAKAGGITVRYAPGMDGLKTLSSISVSDETVEHALAAVLKSAGLTFQAIGAKTAFVYPDTPANREKYTATIRVFTVAAADPTLLASELNRDLRSPTEPFQALILTVREPPTIIVRAVPEIMARAAAWIADHDKEQ